MRLKKNKFDKRIKAQKFMQKILQICFFLSLSIGLLNSADAQRSRQLSQGRTSSAPSRSFSSSSRSSVSRQSSSRPTPSRTFSNTERTYQPRATENVSRNMTTRNSVERTTAQRNYSPASPQRNYTATSPQRITATRNGYNSYSRQNRMVSNNYRYNNYRYNNYRTSYYGNIYGRRTVFMYGPRYRVIPHNFISIRFGGYPYYYHGGCFYGYYSGYYQPIFPPFGLRITVLPFGYRTIFIGTIPFYYYNGIYYRQFDNSYEVVDAPMGATVSALPQGARSVLINGEKLYELNGTYYKADRDSNGRDVFIVVGKNGVINNTDEPQTNMNNAPASLEIGDIMNQLPEGSKVVTVNGQQLYETPDDIYLQEQSENGTVEYKVVGK